MKFIKSDFLFTLKTKVSSKTEKYIYLESLYEIFLQYDNDPYREYRCDEKLEITNIGVIEDRYRYYRDIILDFYYSEVHKLEILELRAPDKIKGVHNIDNLIQQFECSRQLFTLILAKCIIEDKRDKIKVIYFSSSFPNIKKIKNCILLQAMIIAEYIYIYIIGIAIRFIPINFCTEKHLSSATKSIYLPVLTTAQRCFTICVNEFFLKDKSSEASLFLGWHIKIKPGKKSNNSNIISEKKVFGSHVWASIAALSRKKVIVYPHGGFPDRDDLKNSTSYFSSLNGYKYISKFKSEIFKKKFTFNYNEHARKILLCTYNQNQKPLTDGMCVSDYNIYCDRILKIARAIYELPIEIRNNIYYRDKTRLCAKTPVLALNRDKEKNFNESLSSCGLVIIFYNMTLPLWLLKSNVPFILLWSSDEFTDDMSESFRGSGLLHDDVGLLINQILSFSKYGVTWWKTELSEHAQKYKYLLADRMIGC